MQIRDKRNFLAGLLLVGFGLGALLIARTYKMARLSEWDRLLSGDAFLLVDRHWPDRDLPGMQVGRSETA